MLLTFQFKSVWRYKSNIKLLRPPAYSVLLGSIEIRLINFDCFEIFEIVAADFKLDEARKLNGIRMALAISYMKSKYVSHVCV